MALTDNLVSYWNCNEASGTITDQHGSNNSVSESVTYGATGKIGNALDFESTSSDTVSFGDVAALEPTDALSISLWMKPETIVENMAVMDKGDGVTAWNLQLRTSGQNIRFNIDTSSAVTTDTPISAGSWFHIVGTWDGTTAKIYVNNDTPHTAAASTLTQNANALRMGSHYGGAANFFDGLIDEVGFWNRALTAAEVAELYNSGNGLAYPFTSGDPQPIKIFDVRFG